MNINPHDFLSEEQKEKIGNKVYEKMMASIDNIDTKAAAKLIQQEITTGTDWVYILEDVLDYQKLAKPIQDKIIKALKS